MQVKNLRTKYVEKEFETQLAFRGPPSSEAPCGHTNIGSLVWREECILKVSLLHDYVMCLIGVLYFKNIVRSSVKFPLRQ